MRRLAYVTLLSAMSAAAMAQQPIGTVGVQDATVAGELQVTNGRTVLVGSTTVTAKDHTAEVTLNRGGSFKVCATSGLHVTVGKSSSGVQPLMLALDRGAVEVKMTATTSDVVMTPDLRFVLHAEGPLDLRLRVTRNGDTCVENRGDEAPTLGVSDQFGESAYELRAGQHVLFEHGSLKEVVDHESSPCGCPTEPVVSVADVGVTTTPSAAAAPGSVVAATQAAAQHPFPAAVSQGLAPVAAVPQAAPGVAHAQVATTLSYGAGTTGEPGGSVGEESGAASGVGAVAGGEGGKSGVGSEPAEVRAEAPLPPAAPSASGIRHRIGHFFKRLFGRG
jgi:hypothetical protein